MRTGARRSWVMCPRWSPEADERRRNGHGAVHRLTRRQAWRGARGAAPGQAASGSRAGAKARAARRCTSSGEGIGSGTLPPQSSMEIIRLVIGRG